MRISDWSSDVCSSDLYPGLLPGMDRAGSLVFRKTAGPVDLGDPGQWWHFEFGADWRHPLGPDSSIAELEDHPVVHIAYADAEAYAAWAGKALPDRKSTRLNSSH